MEEPTYGPAESATWHEEGGIPLPAWRVVVTYPDRVTTFWFISQVGAELFVSERRAPV
jgi:hypothetical protein